MCEGSCDGLGQNCTVEIELPRQEPDVEEVLEAAIEVPKLHHRLELLGYAGLTAVAPEFRWGQDRGWLGTLPTWPPE